MLPEFVIETRFAYIQQTELVTANLTGATRLLLTGATALPLVVALIARRTGRAAAAFHLATTRRLELGMLLIASLFAIQIVALRALTLVDGVVLVALYVLYARRIRGTPEEEPAILGVPAGLVSLPRRYRRLSIVALIVVAAAVVVAIANPFADALLASGTSLGIDAVAVMARPVPSRTPGETGRRATSPRRSLEDQTEPRVCATLRPPTGIRIARADSHPMAEPIAAPITRRY